MYTKDSHEIEREQANESSPVEKLWAKSTGDRGHSLIAHMLDSAATAQAILERESLQTLEWAASSFGLSIKQIASYLAFVVGLHDIGKAIPGFQVKWELGRKSVEAAGLTFPRWSLVFDRHDEATGGILIELMPKAFPKAAWHYQVAHAVAAHHGYVLQPRRPQDDSCWKEVRQALFSLYCKVLNPPEPRIDSFSTPALSWLMGLTSISDWIASNPDFFPPEKRGATWDSHYKAAYQLALQSLDAIRWNPWEPLLKTDNIAAEELLKKILGNRAQEPVKLRPLQAVGGNLLSSTQGPSLVLVEAPMGEGKTELAYIAYLYLQAANGHRGLYVAMPTQATGNALFERTLLFLRAFASNKKLDVQLVHSCAAMNETVWRLRSIAESSEESVVSSAWFAQRKRPLISPYGVGTIDQALYASLNVKHSFVRLWGLANRVVVLDEVHAYDTYTSGLIEALLRWLKVLRCSVIVMSATLPKAKRDALLKAWDVPTPIADVAYPRLLVADTHSVRSEVVTCRKDATITIEIEGIEESLEEVAELALEFMERRGCGVVIVNTVSRAQQLFCLLKNKTSGEGELLLFHARYPADERSKKEQTILARFGPRGQRPAKALLIATQVAEQSLDVDFDYMFSDLAPIDLLLQRAGRLHRHHRSRPRDYASPRLIVSGLLADRLPELKETAWGFVYEPYILYRTWQVLQHNRRWRLPTDIDVLVQAVYGNEPEDPVWAAWQETFDEALGVHLATQWDMRQRANNVALDALADYPNAFLERPRASEEGEGGLEISTRQGELGIGVIPVYVSEEGWCVRPESSIFDPDSHLDDAVARELYHRQLRVTRREIMQELLNKPIPKAFESHPLLRDLRPLPLASGETVIGSLMVRLDPELGLVYEKEQS